MCPLESDSEQELKRQMWLIFKQQQKMCLNIMMPMEKKRSLAIGNNWN